MTKPGWMPNRNFRASDEVWNAALKRAEEDGEILSDAIRLFLIRYGRREDSWHTQFSPREIEDLFARVRKAEAAYRGE